MGKDDAPAAPHPPTVAPGTTSYTDTAGLAWETHGGFGTAVVRECELRRSGDEGAGV